MPAEFSDGLCLRQWDWSETSQTVLLFTRSHGLVRALGKGSKRAGSPYSGGVEVLTEGSAGVIFRTGSELALLTEWDLKRTFPALRTSLAAHRAGLYIADLISRMIREHDPHPAMYDATIRVLGLLGTVGGPELITAALLRFQWTLLEETGYRPGLMVDAETGKPLASQRSYHFVPKLGGFTAGVVGDSGGWPVKGETLEALRKTSLGESVTGPSGERANRLLASYFRQILGEEPATLALVFPRRLLR